MEKVKLNRMGNFAAKAKSIVNNPYIPKDKKVELMNRLNNEVCMIRDAHAEFVKTREYQDMPDNEQERLTDEENAETVTSGTEKANTEESYLKESDQGTTDAQGTDQEDPDTEKSDSTILAETGTKSNPEELSFEKMSNEIEQFVVKNSNSKPIFQANV